MKTDRNDARSYLVEQFGDGEDARYTLRDAKTQRVVLSNASHSEVISFALRRLPIPDLLNGLAVSGPLEPDMPRVDASGWSVEKLVNAIMGPLADSAVEELVRRANGECKTVADLIYADVQQKLK
jgi:hypothetical protein